MKLISSLILSLFLFVSLSFAETYSVSDVQVQGNERVPSKAVLEASNLKAGKVTSEQISQAIKNIYKLGGIDDIVVQYVSQKVIFVIKERPYVRKIFTKGNEAADSEDLAQVIKLEDKRYYEPLRLAGISKSLELYYQTLGYLDAEVDYEVKEIEDNQVDLTFNIVEGKKFKVSEIKVVSDNEDLDLDDVIGDLQTTTYSWWSSWLVGTGRLNQAYLDSDKGIILQYLLDRGYINGQVSDAKVERDDDELIVIFNVDEGQQFSLGHFTASGDLINGSLEDTLDLLDLETGEVFNASKIRELSLKVGDEYADYGYAFANVVPETNIHFEDKIIDLDFNIDKGKLVSINQINIRGNDKTYDNVIRRELKVQEQETYSRAKVQRSEALIRRLGFFQQVDIAAESVEGSDDLIDLNVQVEETSTGSFSIGGGYGSGDGALFNIRLSENNFLGTGRRVTFNADLGDRRDSLILALNDRRFLDSYWQVGLQGLRRDRVFTDFDRRLSGGSFTLGYPLEEFFGEWANDISASMRYEYLDVKIHDIDPNDAAQLVIDSEGDSSVSGVTPRLFRNTIDNPLNPTTGSRQTLSAEFTGLGGQEEYYLFEARNEMFFPLVDFETDKLVFSWRTNFGFGDNYDGGVFPLFRRYFPGGINSVRGFKARTMGPEDENGNEFGGSKQFINNLELIFPLAASAGLKGVVFYDIGEAFDDNQSINFSDLREAVGFGFRWTSPLGPLRVEFGHPLDKRDGESNFVTLFSFGSPLY